MPSSYSASARYTLQATGENNNTWGVILNQGVFQLVDDSIMGRLGFALSGPKALTTVNGATDEARMAFLDVTGGTGGTITIPAVSKGYFVRNAAIGNVIISTGGAKTYTVKPNDAGPVFSDGASVYGLQIAGLSIQDYISSAITGTGQLPPAVGNVGKALIVQDIGAGAQWLPGLIGAAQIGYTPANKAGDTFTGNVYAPQVGVAARGPVLAGDGATYADVVLDATLNSRFRYNWSTGLLAYFASGNQVMSVSVNGFATFAGGGSFVGGVTASGLTVQSLAVGANFSILTDVNSSVIYLHAGQGTRLNYSYAAGQFSFDYGGVPKFYVDSAGNGTFIGSLTAASMNGAVLTNGSVAGAKLAAGAVGNAQLAGGAAVANIGYTPLNRAGDTVTGPLTVQGNLVAQANATVSGSVKGIAGIFAGNSGRVVLGTDDATYGRVYLDISNGCYIHCNWNTGKLSFYVGGTIVASLDAQGNFVVRGTFAFTTVPTP